MKKQLLPLLCLLMTTSSWALDLFLQESHDKKIPISIEKWGQLRVNNACLKNKKDCEAALSAPKKTELKTGNPASDFCLSKQGLIEILSDKLHNEYEYCVLKKVYFVDAWDFLESEKKGIKDSHGPQSRP